MYDWQIGGFDLYHGDIGLFVRAHDFRLKFAAVLQFHIDPVRAFEDVIIRIDVAIVPDDESRAFTLDGLRIARISAGRILILGTLEKEVFEGRIFARIIFLVTSMMTTLGATISKTFVKALFSWWTTSLPASAAAGGTVEFGPVSGWASGAAA